MYISWWEWELWYSRGGDEDGSGIEASDDDDHGVVGDDVDVDDVDCVMTGINLRCVNTSLKAPS